MALDRYENSKCIRDKLSSITCKIKMRTGMPERLLKRICTQMETESGSKSHGCMQVIQNIENIALARCSALIMAYFDHYSLTR